MFINQMLQIVAPVRFLGFFLKNPGLVTPAARLIALDQSGRAEAAASVIDSAENGFLYVSLMVGAPGSYYLVFLVPCAGNLILYPRSFLTLLLVWGTSLQCQAAA